MLRPYTQPGLPGHVDSEAGRRLLQLVDAYAYRDRLALPKLIVLGTNDRYWTLDALNLYWEDLPGEKHVLYVPNAGHERDDADEGRDLPQAVKRMIRARRRGRGAASWARSPPASASCD